MASSQNMQQTNKELSTNSDLKEFNIKQSDQGHYIGHFHHLPKSMQDNENITSGYRINFNTPAKILKSLFMVHNQSVNIWTHLGAAIFIFAFIIYFFLIATSPQISNKMSTYKESLVDNLNKYKQSIENLTLSQWWNTYNLNNFGAEMSSKHSEISQRLGNNVNQWRSQLSNKTEQLKNSFALKLNQSLAEFQSIRHKFQNLYLPWVSQKFYNSLNYTYIQQLKSRLESLKQTLDSDEFYYLDMGSTNPNPQNISRWPISVFLFSALFCLMCSATFHLFYPMSQKTFPIFLRLDYAGISILIAGSGFPIFYYWMYCTFNWAIFYETVSMAGGILLFIMSLSDWFYKPENLWLKGTSYVLYGLHYSIPFCHMFINKFFFDSYGDTFNFTSSIPWILLLASSYIGGCAIYAKRCPQRHYPGKLNICGHSHQIWHCMVVLGIVFTYIAIIQVYESRKEAVCPVNID